MAGIRTLKKIQLGQEATAGTEVAATAIWRGTGSLRDDIEVVEVDEHIGFVMETDRTYISKYGGTFVFDPTPATFEQLPYILTAGVADDTDGTQDGTGSGYIYTYTMPTTSVNTFQTFTMEGGDNQQEEQGLYGFVRDFTISGGQGEALMMSANWQTRQVATGTFTAALTPPTVEEILFSKGALYIDADGGTIGTTQVTTTLLDMTLNVNTGIMPKWSADASLDFAFIQATQPEVTLDVTFEHNGSTVTEKSNWRNETIRILRLDFQGSSLTTAGSSYSTKDLIIDLYGKWRSFDELTDLDGNSVVRGVFHGTYNETGSTGGQFIVVNESTTLP